MSRRVHLMCYRERWQLETLFSMMERRVASVVNAATYRSQCHPLMLKAVAHNVLVVLCPLCAPATLRTAP